MIKPWTLALLFLIIVDSIYTIYIGSEGNHLILWTMNKFNISLEYAMGIRVLYCMPLLYILNKTDFSKLTFILYICVYLILAGVQF